MKYFLHDTNSFNDEKISELFIKFGYEGLGLFYTVLEKLASQEKPIKTSVLKSQLRVGKRLEKCWTFMENLGIINSLNGETFNKRFVNYIETYQIKKEKNTKRVSQWREKQDVTETVTHYEQPCNASNSIVSKGIINKEPEELKNWSYEKNDFLRNEQWVYNFCSQKKVAKTALEILMIDFINNIELKEDFKNAAGLRNHFTNHFDKLKREELKTPFKNEHKTNSVPLKSF